MTSRLSNNPVDLSPEEWELQALGFDARAIADQPDPAADETEYRRLRDEARAAGGRLIDWIAANKAGISAIRDRQMLARGSLLRAQWCRDQATLSGIARASGEAA